MPDPDGPSPGRVRWIVDGMNVIGSRPDGWWRDRPGAWRRLADQLAGLAEESGEEVLLVLDGRRPRDWREVDGVEVTFAPGGPNAADDAIAQLTANDEDPAAVRVVTSDRELVRRVEELGAEVVPASSFRARLDG